MQHHILRCNIKEIFIYIPHCLITGMFDDDPLELPYMDGLGLEPNHVNPISVKALSKI